LVAGVLGLPAIYRRQRVLVDRNSGLLQAGRLDGDTERGPSSGHGSKFKIADGSVANGPAGSPLPERSVTVTGDQITVS